MSSSKVSPRTLHLICAIAIGMIFIKAMKVIGAPMDTLATGDNDDIMRYLQVKAWLEGQGWFDARMYRMLAPEGLDLHWSRYVDLGIATLIWPLALFMPLESAMSYAIVFWPLLLLVGLTILTARVAREAFGTAVAIHAVLGLMLWAPTGSAYFAPTRIDHHNVQILLTSIVIFTLILPRVPVRAGIIGGVLAALSFAVGMEMLYTIAAAAILLALRAIWIGGAAQKQFTAFALSLGIAAPLFYAGQNAYSVWAMPRCDVLSLPYLSLTTVGAAAALALVVAAPRIASPWGRLGVVAAVSAAGIALAFPMLMTCLEGPYGALPEDAQKVIYGAITEARPALGRLLEGDDLALILIVPAFIATVLGSLFWVRDHKNGMATEQTTRIGILLVFGWLGLFACLAQLRLILAGAAAYPLIMGYVLGTLLAMRTGPRASLATLGFLAACAGTLFTPIILQLAPKPATASTESADGTESRTPDTCRVAETLETLNTVPAARIFATANISAPMMLLTHHTGLTGPYHRSPDAMAGGLIPFARDEAALREAAAKANADYLLICRDAVHWKEKSFATALAMGTEAEGLTPVDGLHEDLLLLKID